MPPKRKPHRKRQKNPPGWTTAHDVAYSRLSRTTTRPTKAEFVKTYNPRRTPNPPGWTDAHATAYSKLTGTTTRPTKVEFVETFKRTRRSSTPNPSGWTKQHQGAYWYWESKHGGTKEEFMNIYKPRPHTTKQKNPLGWTTAYQSAWNRLPADTRPTKVEYLKNPSTYTKGGYDPYREQVVYSKHQKGYPGSQYFGIGTKPRYGSGISGYYQYPRKDSKVGRYWAVTGPNPGQKLTKESLYEIPKDYTETRKPAVKAGKMEQALINTNLSLLQEKKPPTVNISQDDIDYIKSLPTHRRLKRMQFSPTWDTYQPGGKIPTPTFPNTQWWGTRQNPQVLRTPIFKKDFHHFESVASPPKPVPTPKFFFGLQPPYGTPSPSPPPRTPEHKQSDKYPIRFDDWGQFRQKLIVSKKKLEEVIIKSELAETNSPEQLESIVEMASQIQGHPMVNVRSTYTGGPRLRRPRAGGRGMGQIYGFFP